MAVFIVLLAAVLVAGGQSLPVNSPQTTDVKADPTPCLTALEWEGRCSEWDHVNEYNNRYIISFDAKNQRKRFIEEKRSYMPGHRYVEYLQFYKDKVEYQIDHTYNVCKTLPLGTFRNHSIPTDALLEDQYDVGSPQNPIVAQEWSDRVTGHKKEEWIGVFTTKEEGCWPLFEIYTQDEVNQSISFSTRFFNLSSGIKDPSVFDIPSICKKANFARIPLTELEAPAIPVKAYGLLASSKSQLYGSKDDRFDKVLPKLKSANKRIKPIFSQYKGRML